MGARGYATSAEDRVSSQTRHREAARLRRARQRAAVFQNARSKAWFAGLTSQSMVHLERQRQIERVRHRHAAAVDALLLYTDGDDDHARDTAVSVHGRSSHTGRGTGAYDGYSSHGNANTAGLGAGDTGASAASGTAAAIDALSSSVETKHDQGDEKDFSFLDRLFRVQGEERSGSDRYASS